MLATHRSLGVTSSPVFPSWDCRKLTILRALMRSHGVDDRSFVLVREPVEGAQFRRAASVVPVPHGRLADTRRTVNPVAASASTAYASLLEGAPFQRLGAAALPDRRSLCGAAPAGNILAGRPHHSVRLNLHRRFRMPQVIASKPVADGLPETQPAPRCRWSASSGPVEGPTMTLAGRGATQLRRIHPPPASPSCT